MSERVVCPACFARTTSQCFAKDYYKIQRCKKCNSMFVQNIPSAEELAKIYSSDKYYELPHESVCRIKHENRRRLKVLKNYKLYGSLFDIGSARGLFLDEARASGFDTFGVELSTANVKKCVLNNHQVVHGSLQDSPFSSSVERFDVISCLDVIEHVENPSKFLLTSASILKKNGIMIVSTPNYSGVVAKLLRHRDPYLTPPEHLNFFTLKGMQNLFSYCKLKVEKRLTFGYLTNIELDRVMSKYGPTFLSSLEPVIKPIIPYGFRLLNNMKVGLEQEFYLSKMIC